MVGYKDRQEVSVTPAGVEVRQFLNGPETHDQFFALSFQLTTRVESLLIHTSSKLRMCQCGSQGSGLVVRVLDFTKNIFVKLLGQAIHLKNITPLKLEVYEF